MSEVVDFGPTTPAVAVAAEPLQFGRQSSFEDEVEKLYRSNQDSDNPTKSMTNSSISTPTEEMSATAMEFYDPMKMILADPKEVTGQTTLAMKMESEFSDLEANGLKDFLDRECPIANDDEEMKTVEEEGKETIDEMEKFLGIHEETRAATFDNMAAVQTALQLEEALPASLAEEILTLEQMATLQAMDVPELEEGPQLSQNSLAQGERLLDALIATPGLLPLEAAESKPPTDILKEAIDLNLANDSGYIEEPEEVATVSTPVVPATSVKRYDVTNVTEVQSTDGKKVIIIIQPVKAPTSVAPVASTVEEGYASSVDEDNDSDWTPELTSGGRCRKQELKKSKNNRPGRKLKERTNPVHTADSGKVTKRSYQHIKDRKVRKQMQNVEAARKYRDRKKAEQMEAEMEVDVLVRKNAALKEKKDDLQNEVRILKNFMKQMGILKS